MIACAYGIGGKHIDDGMLLEWGLRQSRYNCPWMESKSYDLHLGSGKTIGGLIDSDISQLAIYLCICTKTSIKHHCTSQLHPPYLEEIAQRTIRSILLTIQSLITT